MRRTLILVIALTLGLAVAAIPAEATVSPALTSPPPVCQYYDRTPMSDGPTETACADVGHGSGYVFASVDLWCDAQEIGPCTGQVARLRLYVDGVLWEELTQDPRVIYYDCRRDGKGSRHRFQTWTTYVFSFWHGETDDNYRNPLLSHPEYSC